MAVSRQQLELFVSPHCRQTACRRNMSERNTEVELQMLLKKSISKTRNFFQRAFRNLRSLLLGEYQQLHKTPPCPSFSSICTIQNEPCPNDSCKEICVFDRGRAVRKDPCPVSSKQDLVKENIAKRGSSSRSESPLKIIKQEKKMEISKSGRKELPQRMKELEMMDVGDVDHVLDVEEVLHYYSRLRSPAYLDIVDEFFTDMYSEFFIPQPKPVVVRNSKRIRGPVRF